MKHRIITRMVIVNTKLRTTTVIGPHTTRKVVGPESKGNGVEVTIKGVVEMVNKDTGIE